MQMYAELTLQDVALHQHCADSAGAVRRLPSLSVTLY